MTQHRGELGATDPQPLATDVPAPAAAESTLDKAARDTEFAVFYTQDFTRLVGFLIVQGAGHLAADIAQEAMTEAYRQWDLLDRPSAWVRLVAQRNWWKRNRRDRVEIPHDDLPEPSGLLSSAEYEQIESRHTFLALVAELTDLQRQVLSWYYDGYQPVEIAVVLGRKPVTVRSALREARGRVQATMRLTAESP
jgi:RNA polymerase sigma-70 factor (ECF subfamily)